MTSPRSNTPKHEQSSRRVLPWLIGSAMVLSVLISGCTLIPNLPPTARILADRVGGNLPLHVQFDGTTSDDTDGIVVSYAWTFGDGMTSDAMRPDHIFVLAGSHTVTLTVVDERGASATASLDIQVVRPNSEPVPTFVAVPSIPVPEETVTLDASASVDGDGQIESYQWDLGDGNVKAGAVIEHQFAEPGTYTIALTVVDDQGAAATLHREFLVADTNQAPQPQLELSASTLNPGETLHCSGAGSVDPDGDIVAYEWRFGDGGQSTGETTTHVYTSNGTYRVRLTTMDNDGALQSVEQTVSVGSPSDPTPPPPDPATTISRTFRWSYGGTRSVRVSIPESLADYYGAQPRGVWGEDGYAPFVLDRQDDALIADLRDDLMINDSYQATIENALAFVQGAIEYQRDPEGVEYPRYPVETLIDQAGDCEDSAILYASIIRTFGYSFGVLLIMVDTDGDQVSDHVAVLVRVASCFVDAHPERSLWEISGKTYAFAETALTNGYLALGIDPWGIEREDITAIWDVGGNVRSLRVADVQRR